MSSPYSRPDWPQEQPPPAQPPQDSQRPESTAESSAQPRAESPSQQAQPPRQEWADPHADPPTEPIPVVAEAVREVEPQVTAEAEPQVDPDAATQQWTMEPPPYATGDGPGGELPNTAAHPAEASGADVDSEAPTQQWTMQPPPQLPSADPGRQDPPPSGPPPDVPERRSYEPPPPPPPNNNMRWIWAAVAVVVLGVVIALAYVLTRPKAESPESAPPTAAAPTTEPARGCDYPAEVLDLTGWNLTVPLLGDAKQQEDNDDEGEKSDAEKAADKAAGRDDSKKAKEINQPELATFVAKPYFRINSSCDGVAFRAPVNGITTSGSKYPRSELREMSPDGSKTAAWSSSAGAHTFVVNEAFTALPQGKPNLVGVQIHDEDDDVSTFRLEGTNLYITEGDDTHHKLVTDKYVLGTKYEAKYIVSGDVIQAFYNGQLQTTITKQFSDAYFKAGAYTQANCSDSTVQCNDSTYGETTVYSLHVEHS